MIPPDIITKLQTIIDGIRRLRASLYPANWKYDPFLQIERDLTALIRDIQAD